MASLCFSILLGFILLICNRDNINCIKKLKLLHKNKFKISKFRILLEDETYFLYLISGSSRIIINWSIFCLKMSKVLRNNQNEVMKTRSSVKQSRTQEIAKVKNERKTSRYLLEEKENTPPVALSKTKKFKSVNKKNEVDAKIKKKALRPVKVKPAIKLVEKDLMLNILSPILRPKSVSTSGRNHKSRTLCIKDDDNFKFEETIDDILPDVAEVTFRRRSSNTVKKEICMLTAEQPPLEYWKMLAEQRLVAFEKTVHQNELMRDQISVFETENSQLKEILHEAKDMIMVIKSTFQEDA